MLIFTISVHAKESKAVRKISSDASYDQFQLYGDIKILVFLKTPHKYLADSECFQKLLSSSFHQNITNNLNGKLVNITVSFPLVDPETNRAYATLDPSYVVSSAKSFSYSQISCDLISGAVVDIPQNADVYYKGKY